MRTQVPEVVEEWRPVVGYEGWYSVSNLGRVRRDRGGRGARAGRILRAGVSSNGLLLLILFKDGEPRTQLVRRLVCDAFHGLKPLPEHEVSHRNGDRSDNRASNLRWALPAEIVAEKVRSGAVPHGEGHHNAKLTADDAREIAAQASAGVPVAAVGRAFGVNPSSVSKIKLGRRWRRATRGPDAVAEARP